MKNKLHREEKIKESYNNHPNQYPIKFKNNPQQKGKLRILQK